MIFFTALFVCFVFTASGEKRLNLQTESLLQHLDKLSDLDRNASNRRNISALTSECSTRRYSFTVYYRMTYFRVCGNQSSVNEATQNGIAGHREFVELCSLLQSYDSSDSDQLASRIDKLAIKHRIYGAGITSDQRWLASQACKYIGDYYSVKTGMNSNISATQDQVYPNYTEWLVHSVPFALPVACGFSEEIFEGNHFSMIKCLAPSLKWGLYSSFILDSILILAVFTANLIILAVSWRTTAMHNVHGCFRVSLAVADLMVGIVVCGAINTTYSIYYSRHKFTGVGNKPSILDYHHQTYINAFGAITVISISASIFTLVAITVDRFFAIFRPMVYKLHNTKAKRWAVAVVAIIWLISLILAICPVFIPTMPYTLTALGVFVAPNFYMAYVVCFGLSLLCIWILNGAMYISTRRRMKKSLASGRKARSSGEGEGKKANEKNNNKGKSDDAKVRTVSANISTSSTFTSVESAMNGRHCPGDFELSITATVRVVVAAFTISILPSIAVMCSGSSSMSLEPRSRDFDPVAKATWNAFAYLSSRILFSNSFFNCIIYSYRSKHFRWVARKLFLFSGPVSRHKADDSSSKTLQKSRLKSSSTKV